MEALLSSETLNYMDDGNFATMKEEKITQMRPKLRIVIKKRTSQRLLCTAMLVKLFHDYEWVHIPCNIQLSSNYFICEKLSTPSRNLTSVIISRGQSCLTLHIFIGGSCWTISDSPGDQLYIVSKNLYKSLNPFLTAWSLGTKIRKYIAVTEKRSQTRCFVTIGLDFQRIKRWKINNCRKKLIKFYLKRTISPVITDQCDTPRHFKCANQFCMLSLYICDGLADCPDQSDENNCTAHSVTNDIKFHCISGKYNWSDVFTVVVEVVVVVVALQLYYK